MKVLISMVFLTFYQDYGKKKAGRVARLRVSALFGYEHQVATNGASDSSEVYLMTCRSDDVQP